MLDFHSQPPIILSLLTSVAIQWVLILTAKPFNFICNISAVALMHLRNIVYTLHVHDTHGKVCAIQGEISQTDSPLYYMQNTECGYSLAILPPASNYQLLYLLIKSPNLQRTLYFTFSRTHWTNGNMSP